ncbi:hypothetical protein [Paenibacillus segetis]|uniref:Uncharacterized protein n=1 Tax=Paenibacillus segetis TaxID=1325360 RepID=A0ABQ1Y418_9BACL|nr:hypothetical protein [Paenibacillus segetis]GGH11134.1 hypothetical protein GCM10008013_02810 [Paenibacillus segetis]
MKKKADPEAIKNEMMTYLEEKYGEEFVPMSLSLSNFADSYDSLWAYPKNGTKRDSFEVWGTRMEDGSYSMSDGYFGIYIKPKYEEVLSGFVGDVYKEFKLFTDFGEGILPDRLNKETKIEEIYSKDEVFSSDTVIFVKQESVAGVDVEASLREIAERMRKNKMVVLVRLYVVHNEKFQSIGPGMQNLSALRESGYFVGDYKSVMVTSDLKIRQNGKEVKTDG